MNEMSEHQEWLDVIKMAYDEHQGQGAIQVLFPEYRPDLARAVAHCLGLGFYDYRKEKMLSESWNAGNITLDEMTETLLAESADTSENGLLVYNIEALLATKPDEQRQQWLADCLDQSRIDWPKPVVLPLAIYQLDTVDGHPRVCNLEFDEFPRESFLMRLAI
jgi:hypothetical protein